MIRVRHIALIGLIILTGYRAFAQDQPHSQAAAQTTAPPSPPAMAPNPVDVASADAIIAAVYNVISGPAGQKRDWDRMHSLFYPGARLIRTTVNKEGGLSAESFSVEEYVERASRYFEKNGFAEREIARRTEKWANILQAFSTYESRHDAQDRAPFARGINSMQLFFDGTRWWILTIYWQEEGPQNPLPAEFLPTVH
jgi:hypothetical protein